MLTAVYSVTLSPIFSLIMQKLICHTTISHWFLLVVVVAFIMSTLNVSFISLFISDISACFYISCFVFFAEEERRVRANDREYNEKFQYAVSHTFNLYSHTFNLYLLPIPPPSSLFLSAEQLHHDLKVQHHHLPTSQPV